MILHLRQRDTGLWANLHGETPGEWHALEDAAARGETTDGWGYEAPGRLSEIAGRRGWVVTRVVRDSASAG